MADDATERLLKEQARAHGLDAYAPEPEDVAPKTIAYAIRQENEKDEAALRGFAGLRGGASSSFEIGAQWSAAPAPPAPAPIGLDLSAFDSVEALAAEGLDALKAELTRRGAKAGGTKKGGGQPTRDDFTFPTSNKQLAFLQHIYRNLKPGGRAAVAGPANCVPLATEVVYCCC